MKTFKLIFFVFTALLVVAFSSCESPNDCPEGGSSVGKQETVYIDNSFLKAYPYNLKGDDTLTFKNTEGETAILYGAVEKFWRHTSFHDDNSTPACPVFDYYEFEINSHVFTGNHPDLNRIVVNLYVEYDRNLSYTPDPRDITYYEFLFPGKDWIKYRANVFNHDNYYTTNVEINSKTYSGYSFGKAGDTSAVYSKYHGILKIKTANDTWLNVSP